MLVGEEVFREKAQGRRIKAVKRVSMALWFCEKIVYVVYLDFVLIGKFGKFSSCDVKVRSQYRES